MAAHLASRASPALNQLSVASAQSQLQQMMQQQLRSGQGMHPTPLLAQQFGDQPMSLYSQQQQPTAMQMQQAQVLANLSNQTSYQAQLAPLSLPQLMEQREQLQRRKADLQKTIETLEGHIRAGAFQGDSGPQLALVKHRQDHEILSNAENQLASYIQLRRAAAAAGYVPYANLGHFMILRLILFAI